MEFTKVLSPSAAKYKYFALPTKVREDFPEKNAPFKLKFKNKMYTLHVNNKDCIMLTQLYYEYQFVEGDEVRIIKKKDGTFELTVNPTASM